MIAAPLLVGAAAALLQTAVLPTLFLDAWATPLLPAALVAAWAATRRPEETWTIVLVAALILGVMSRERAGWFLLALLPSVGIAVSLDALAPRHRNFGARLGRAVATALAGTICYVTILAIASGNGGALATTGPQIAAAGLGTMVLATLGVIALAPLRARPAGLFE